MTEGNEKNGVSSSFWANHAQNGHRGLNLQMYSGLGDLSVAKTALTIFLKFGRNLDLDLNYPACKSWAPLNCPYGPKTPSAHRPKSEGAILRKNKKSMKLIFLLLKRYQKFFLSFDQI